MSVINKMLRDLDARQGPTTAARHAPDLAAGVHSVRQVAQATALKPDVGVSKWALAGGALALIAGGAGVAAWLNRSSSPAIAGKPATEHSSTLALPVVSATPPVNTVAAPVSPPDRPTPELLDVRKPELPALAKSSSDVNSIKPALPAMVQRAGAPLTVAVAASVPTTASQPSGVPGPAVVATTRTQTPAELLEDSVRLWERGSRDQAQQLLRQKLDVGDALAAVGGSSAVLWQLTGELTRMELAEGKLQTALDRLVRLEAPLMTQPVAWATRGNLTQRMGRHGESAKAYITALALRPDEPRWLLGAAVSLAAEGKAAQASEYAQKAQERGTVSPDIAAFLRQQGVTLR